MVFVSPHAKVDVPNVDICSFVFGPNPYNTVYPHDRVLSVDGNTGQSMTYAQIKDVSSRLGAGWIENAGLKQGDVVAVFAPNQYNHTSLFLSLLSAKLVITPGNPAYTEGEFHHQISSSGAVALVTVPGLLPVLVKVCEKIGIPKSRIFLFGDQEVAGCRPFKSIISTSKAIEYPLKGINPIEDTAFLCYSSGTTGVAKGVMLTHQNFVSQVMIGGHFDEMGAGPDDIALGFLPYYHIFGLCSLILSPIYKMSVVVTMTAFDLELLCQLVEKHRITLAAIVPPIALLLAKHPIVTKYDMTSLRLLGCGAAPLNREQIASLSRRMPAVLTQGYGMTETTSGILAQKYHKRTLGSVGTLFPNCECRIVDENMNDLGDDQDGELLFRGPIVMKGYLNNPKANEETFVDGGWMRTGDVGRFDSKSKDFFIVDRIKELIKYKGFQVAPAELEALLLTREDILDCCVVGKYDESQATELPVAFVVLDAASVASDEKAKEIHAYVAENVTNHKYLRGGIRFVAQIPKSPTGKILRREVKDIVKKEQEADKLKAKL
ncbi:hypothetical protein J3Q64DRAFT_1846281 [Phycomyces blakesleeanus]|uniref:Uncharacterized protein n=1 Tax=Phycomyces blakesleeanus TaxID=4837 RepID=A0ABR3B609_PHYBL